MPSGSILALYLIDLIYFPCFKQFDLINVL